MTNRQEDDSKAIPKAQKSVTKDLTFVASPDSALGQIVLDSLCILEVPLGRVARLLDLLWEDDREISHHVCAVIDCSITYANCAVGFLAAVAIAGFDDIRPTVAVIDFLQHETVQVAVYIHQRSPRFGHVSYALPPCHCTGQKKKVHEQDKH